MQEYQPLHKSLTIKNSPINGLGLFSTKKILKDTLLGISHHLIDNEIIRTPLGGFYNHSYNPNCVKMLIEDKYYLHTLKNIEKDEEITVKYTFPEYNQRKW